MKRVLSRIIAAICLSGALVACAPQSDSASEAGTVRVLAPMSNSKAGYSLDILELKGIEDLQTVSGHFARFFLSPRIVDNHLQGTAPKGRFIRNGGGDYIPANEITQQLVTVYAHMQRLAQLDEDLGAGGVNKWPRDIGVAVKVKGGVYNNAFYDGKTDSMLFVPYDQQGLPIAINGGILAHEHFHSLFYKLVLKESPYKGNAHDRPEFLNSVGITEEKARERKVLPIMTRIEGEPMDASTQYFYYHAALSRGLNEGLADFWGWMYTGDPDFIAQSLPNERSARSLKAADENSVNALPSLNIVQRALNIYYSSGDEKAMKQYVVGLAYSMATSYSRVMKRFTDIYARERSIDSLQARKDVAKILVKTLPKIAEGFQKLEGRYYTSVDFMVSFIEQLGAMHEAECSFVKDVLNNTNSDLTVKFACKKDEQERWSVEKTAVKAPAESESETASSESVK